MKKTDCDPLNKFHLFKYGSWICMHWKHWSKKEHNKTFIHIKLHIKYLLDPCIHMSQSFLQLCFVSMQKAETNSNWVPLILYSLAIFPFPVKSISKLENKLRLWYSLTAEGKIYDCKKGEPLWQKSE